MVLWISEMGSRRAAFSSSNSWCDAQRVTCRNWWKIDINWHWDHTGTMEDPKVCFIPLTGQNPQVKGKLSRTWGRPPVFRFQRCPESPAFHLADPSKVMKHKFLLVSRCFMRCPALNSWSPVGAGVPIGAFYVHVWFQEVLKGFLGDLVLALPTMAFARFPLCHFYWFNISMHVSTPLGTFNLVTSPCFSLDYDYTNENLHGLLTI